MRRPKYLIVAAVVFAVLIAIEREFDGGFVRHTLGDAIVVVLVYAVLMASTRWSRYASAVVSLSVAYAVELTQALNLIERLGLTPNRLTNVIFGNTFTWQDILAYTAGIVATLAVEELRRFLVRQRSAGLT